MAHVEKKEFRFSATRHQRLADIAQILDASIPADESILLVGESEGTWVDRADYGLNCVAEVPTCIPDKLQEEIAQNLKEFLTAAALTK